MGAVDGRAGGRYTLDEMALVRLENVGVRRGGKWVLWDVSLEIEPGEILGVFGRSGSGKTALARILAGLDQPTSGSIILGDPSEPAILRGEMQPRSIAHASERTASRRMGAAACVGLAFEKPALAPELTVYENLAVFASLWGVRRRARAKQIAFLLELVGLAEQRSARAVQLSSGEARRAEIARALVADAPLTVIDSPADTLDRDILERLWDHLLAQRRDHGKAFIVMTGSAGVAGLCGRMAVIHRGKIVYSGRPDDFRRLAGEDMVVLGDLNSPALRKRVEERLSVVIKEEEGFLSFRVANGERMVTDLLAEFGSDVGCVYLKRPTLDDALDVLAGGSPVVPAESVKKRDS